MGGCSSNSKHETVYLNKKDLTPAVNFDKGEIYFLSNLQEK